jgi:hypothetical protein
VVHTSHSRCRSRTLTIEAYPNYELIRGMATIPELLDGHVTLAVECLDRLYLNGYIGKLATGPGLVFLKVLAEQQGVPVYQFRHKERNSKISGNTRNIWNLKLTDASSCWGLR